MRPIFSRFFSVRAGALLLLVILSAASYGPVCAQSATALQGIPVASAVSESESNYVLAPNDLVKLTVFQEADLESTVRIAKDGSTIFPLIGPVKIGGKTVQEGSRLIREMLAKDYLVNPQVSLTVMEYAKRRFVVLGQVQRPGAYEMPDRDSVGLLQAIGMAGGYTRVADPGKITVKRNQGGRDDVIKINAKNLAKGTNQKEFEVAPGDVITVGESLF